MNNSNINKFYGLTKSYILLFTLVDGMSFVYWHLGQCYENKFIGLITHIFYYTRRIYTK